MLMAVIPSLLTVWDPCEINTANMYVNVVIKSFSGVSGWREEAAYCITQNGHSGQQTGYMCYFLDTE